MAGRLRNSPATVLRAAADGPDRGAALYRDSLGPSLAGQGLLGLHVPERDGGQGFGLTELSVALEELGRALVPGSFAPTVLASAVLISAGPGRKGRGGTCRWVRERGRRAIAGACTRLPRPMGA